MEPDTIQYTRSEQPERGTLHHIKFGERSGALLTSTALATSENLGVVTRNLDAQISSALQTIHDRNADGYTGKARESIINAEIAKLRPFVQNFIAVTKDARSNHQIRKARTLEFNRDAEPNAALRSDLRAWFMSHSILERNQIALESDRALAISIYEVGQKVAGLDDAIWHEFVNHYMALNHIHNSGLETGFALQSTPEFITNAGVDHEAVARTAKQAIQKFNEEFKLLNDAEAYIQSVVAALVLLTGRPAQEFIGV